MQVGAPRFTYQSLQDTFEQPPGDKVMPAENFDISNTKNDPDNFKLSYLSLIAGGDEKLNTIREDSMDSYMKQMEFPNDLKDVQDGLGVVDELNCDTRSQSPEITGKPLQDACGIEISKLYPKVEESVTLVVGHKTTGTAFKLCVDDSCYYVTNDHVVGKNETLGLATEDDKRIQFLKVVARNPENDLALIEPPPGDTRPGLSVGEESKTGDPVFTFGHPLGYPKDVINAGLVVELRTPFETVDQNTGAPKTLPRAVISTDHSLPGQSGSPEFNKKGEVVGVKVMGINVGGKFGTVGSVTIPIDGAVKMIKEQSTQKK